MPIPTPPAAPTTRRIIATRLLPFLLRRRAKPKDYSAPSLGPVAIILRRIFGLSWHAVGR